MNTRSIGVLLFDEVELLDFAGPCEVLSMANAIVSRQDPQEAPFSVFTVSETPERVIARGGLRVLPDHTIDGCPTMDVLLVPGGPGVRREMHNQRLIEWIITRAQQSLQVASVCTGALLLGKARLLAGHRVTTHWAALDELARICPEAIVIRGKRVVESGRIITAAGVCAGIDLALYLVSLYLGEEIGRLTAERMEYPIGSTSR